MQKAFAVHAAAVDQLIHVSNAAWCVKHSSSSEDLVLDMEQHQNEIMKTSLEAVETGMKRCSKAAMIALPSVVQSAMSSPEFTTKLTDVVRNVVIGAEFMDMLSARLTTGVLAGLSVQEQRPSVRQRLG